MASEEGYAVQRDSKSQSAQSVTKKLTKNTDISDPNYRDLVHKFSTI